MADPVLTPGNQTSEFSLASLVIKAAILVQLLAAIAACLPASVGTNHYAAIALAVIAAVTQVFVKLGYIKSRTDLKTAIIQAATLVPKVEPVVDAAAKVIPDGLGAPAAAPVPPVAA